MCESHQSCLVLFMSLNGCSDKQLLLHIFGGEGKASTLFANNNCNRFVFLIDNFLWWGEGKEGDME